MDTLTFLSQYRRQVTIVPDSDLPQLETKRIPENWLRVFEESDPVKRKAKAIALWEQICGNELSMTISYLQEQITAIDLIIDNGQYAVLYHVESHNGEILYYEGGIPSLLSRDRGLEKSWPLVPESVRRFYEQLHNGFYYVPSRAMGLVPLEAVSHFENYEWGIVDDLVEPLQLSMETTFGFFENGSGGYVAVDVTNCADDNAVLWFTNDQPEYQINFWDVTDEWIVIGMQDD